MSRFIETRATARFQVKKVAVLGAGVMGAQIAAHLVNVKVPVVLFDLPAKEGPKNGIVTKAVEGLKKLKPSPLGVADDGRAAAIGRRQLRHPRGQAAIGAALQDAIGQVHVWVGVGVAVGAVHQPRQVDGIARLQRAHGGGQWR